MQPSRKGPEMRHVGSQCRSDLTRLGADRPRLPLGGTGELQANEGPAGLLEFQGAPECTPGLCASWREAAVAGLALGVIGVLLLEGASPFAGVLCVWILTYFPFFFLV